MATIRSISTTPPVLLGAVSVVSSLAAALAGEGPVPGKTEFGRMNDFGGSAGLASGACACADVPPRAISAIAVVAVNAD